MVVNIFHSDGHDIINIRNHIRGIMLKSKIKKIFEKVKNYADKLNKEVYAVYLACKRKDVPWYSKIIPVLVVGYALSPIDFIPDFIPVIGYLDDLVIVPLGISLAIKLIPKQILDECRIQAEIIYKSKNNKNPKIWLAGAFIILIWIILAIWIISMFLRK